MLALSLRELEAEARPHLTPAVFDYFAGGACDEITIRANESGFSRLGLLPRALRGAAERDHRITLLDSPASMPVIVSPTAFHQLAHPDGEQATARAAVASGVIMVVSMASTTAVEDISRAARSVSSGEWEPQLWMQLYVQPDRIFTESVIRRAEDAGCTALVVTVDSPVFGLRERDRRNGFLDLPDGLHCENLRDSTGAVRPLEFSHGLSCADIRWLCGITALPVVVKGIVRPDDARSVVDAGAMAVFVSNHGGRQLDSMPAAIDVLPAVVEAVGAEVPVLLDGGVRRGTDVIKACALGASAVGLGRPVLWGLAVDGAAGVAWVLETLRAELDHAMALCGCSSLDDLSADLLWERSCLRR